ISHPAPRVASHDCAPRRPCDRDLVGVGHFGAPRPDPLRGRQGRPAWPRALARPRGGALWHHGECGRARARRNGGHTGPRSAPARGAARGCSARPRGATRRSRTCGAVAGVGRGGVYDRTGDFGRRRTDLVDLKMELKKLLVDALKLDDVTPEQIQDAAPLFGEGLGLDSIDALELAVAIERRFKVSIPDEEVGKKAFRSIDTLAEYVSAHAK